MENESRELWRKIGDVVEAFHTFSTVLKQHILRIEQAGAVLKQLSKNTEENANEKNR